MTRTDTVCYSCGYDADVSHPECDDHDSETLDIVVPSAKISTGRDLAAEALQWQAEEARSV